LKTAAAFFRPCGKRREASLKDLVEQTRKRLDKLLELGVTTCEIKTGYGLDYRYGI
jgi:imidazolonepropionase